MVLRNVSKHTCHSRKCIKANACHSALADMVQSPYKPKIAPIASSHDAQIVGRKSWSNDRKLGIGVGNRVLKRRRPSSNWASATIEDILYIWGADKGGSVHFRTWYTWVETMFNVVFNHNRGAVYRQVLLCPQAPLLLC